MKQQEKLIKTTDAPGLTPQGKLLNLTVQHSLEYLHKPEVFLERFPIEAIMEELTDAPEIRGKILTMCVNLPQETARELDAEIAGTVLATALRKKNTDAKAILDAFDGEDRIRHLKWPALHSFVTSGNWTQQATTSGKRHTDACAFLQAFIESAMELSLLDAKKIFACLGHELVVACLMREKPQLLEEVVTTAIRLGADEEKAFTPEEFFRLVDAKVLAEIVPVPDLVEKLLNDLAAQCGWLDVASSTQTADTAADAPKTTEVAPIDTNWT